LWVFLFALGLSLTACSVKQEAEEIVEDVTTEKPSGEIVLLKNDYQPGEEIKLAYTIKSDEQKQGWIGIAPSGAAGGEKTGTDTHIETKDINNEIGVLTFNAPVAPGDYDISMTTKGDDNTEPQEVTKVSITVVDPEAETKDISPSIEIEKDTYAPGESIMLSYNAPSTFDKTAWIGLVPSIIERDNERTNYNESIIRKEIAGNTSGKMTFTAPDMPGVYNLRMYNSTTNGREVENVKIIVVK
jgi:hypothetical protein